MTWEELIQKYNLQVGQMTNERKINVLKAKGIYVKQLTKGNRWHPAEFEIIDDSIYFDEWKQHPYLPRELTKDGKIRDSVTKNLCKLLSTTDGYYCCFIDNKKFMHHRLLMETFNPIENSERMFVDHINGKKQDNRLENLRWVTPQQNTFFRDENRQEIQNIINQLIQKNGYENTIKILKKILDN